MIVSFCKSICFLASRISRSQVLEPSWLSLFDLSSLLHLSLDIVYTPRVMADAAYYRKMYDELSARVHELCARRDELELQLGEITTELANLYKTLSHLTPLAGYTFAVDSLSELGITDAVRAVLRPNEKMSAGDVREKMEEKGFDFSRYSAPDASVRTILKRLVDAKPAQAVSEKDGWKIYYSAVPTQGPEISDEDIPF